MNDFKYPGNELELFENAINWKKYFSKIMRPYLSGSVLEVGAGLGANIQFLNINQIEKWTLLEPDEGMFDILQQKKAEMKLPSNTVIVNGVVSSMANDNHFDALVYIDVLEHVENDKDEIDTAIRMLKPGGTLLVLVPAFQHLFSDFDRTVGHFRRYTKKRLQNIIPGSMTKVYLNYLDTGGYFLSAGNKLILKQQNPTIQQVLFWDRKIIPVSKVADVLFGHLFGKSILGIWKKGIVN